jgi:SAM-dependent methyltransferase
VAKTGRAWGLLGRLPYLGGLLRGYRAKSLEIELLRASLVDLTEVPFRTFGPALEEARRVVTEHTAKDEYSSLYRGEEPLYWLHIPGWFAEWATATSPQRILDIGSGYGTLAVFAAIITRGRVHCLDWDPERLAQPLRQRYGIEVAGGNAELMEFPWEEPMDAIVMTEVIEHFNFHPVPTMIKVARALVPGGRLFLSTPDGASWGRILDPYADFRDMPYPDPTLPTVDRHVYQFEEAELRAVLLESGFEILRLQRAPGRWGLHLNVEAMRPA